MYKQKRVLAIHDISCVGKCSLTVALPIISAAGVECSVLPTAVLSTHTGGFKDYTFNDLSNDLLPICRHWKSLGLHFDAIYTGFLAGSEQVDTICEIIDMLAGKDTLVVVDPVMGDNGRLYSSFKDNFPKKMIELCKKLAVGIPFVRVDLYEIKGKVYFGELTLYPGCGFEEFRPDEWDKILGSKIKLPR